jgi:putative tryptophan/tyrosine transport system substrate-binding protein
LLKETVPKASRIGILWSPSAQGAAGHFRETEHAARLLKVQLQSFPLSVPDDVQNVFQAAANGNADALIVVSAGGMARYEAQVVSLALKTRVPVMYTNPRNVFAGGLMSYAADLLELSRGAAGYVDRILKGAKPANLPVQQPTKFELVINLKTAKQTGLTISPHILARPQISAVERKIF